MPVPSSRLPAATPAALTPFWTSRDGRFAKLYHGDVCDVLAGLPERSVHCVVTSPPYWGLRDYSACGCSQRPAPSAIDRNGSGPSGGTEPGRSRRTPDPRCPVCRGSGTVPGTETQLGAEPSPDCGTWGKARCGRCFVCNMVAVFRGVRRVLRDDGTLWLNLGDSYGGASGRSHSGREIAGVKTNNKHDGTRIPNVTGLPSGNLVGVPWRVALALQADGWVLRQDVIWHKPSPMPESVRNRCTKAHEYVFLLTKKMGYFYDAEAIKEKSKGNDYPRPFGKAGNLDRRDQGRIHEADAQTSNKRSVWSVSSQGYPAAHFATFPPALVETCIKAGTSERGCCGRCGAPWRRVTEETALKRDRPNDYVKRTGEEGTGNSCGNTVAGVAVRTVGWEPGCGCVEVDENGDDVPYSTVPCTVLDPFVGSGTTVMVANRLERRGWGIDLNTEYLADHAVKRISGRPLDRSK